MTREDEIKAWIARVQRIGADEEGMLEVYRKPIDFLRYLLEKVERLEKEVYASHRSIGNMGPWGRCECETCKSFRRRKEPTDAS